MFVIFNKIEIKDFYTSIIKSNKLIFHIRNQESMIYPSDIITEICHVLTFCAIALAQFFDFGSPVR
jgi:hypothetical protein